MAGGSTHGYVNDGSCLARSERSRCGLLVGIRILGSRQVLKMNWVIGPSILLIMLGLLTLIDALRKVKRARELRMFAELKRRKQAGDRVERVRVRFIE